VKSSISAPLLASWMAQVVQYSKSEERSLYLASLSG